MSPKHFSSSKWNSSFCFQNCFQPLKENVHKILNQTILKRKTEMFYLENVRTNHFSMIFLFWAVTIDWIETQLARLKLHLYFLLVSNCLSQTFPLVVREISSNFYFLCLFKTDHHPPSFTHPQVTCSLQENLWRKFCKICCVSFPGLQLMRFPW